jgi:hypothetical protein
MVAEGNCFVVYMYENIVQSSLSLGSEQRFYFISPYHENPVYFINYYNRKEANQDDQDIRNCRSDQNGDPK